MQEISHTLQTIRRWLWHATCGGTQDTDAVILLFSRALEPQLFWRSDHILHLQLYVVFVVLICPISTHFMFLLNVLTTQEQILLGFIINGRDRREGRWSSKRHLLWNSSTPGSSGYHHVLLFLKSLILTSRWNGHQSNRIIQFSLQTSSPYTGNLPIFPADSEKWTSSSHHDGVSGLWPMCQPAPRCSPPESPCRKTGWSEKGPLPDSGMTSQGHRHLSGVLEDKEELVSKERREGMASERTGRCIQAWEETRRSSEPWRGHGKDKLGPDCKRTVPWVKKLEFYPLSHWFSNCSVHKTDLSTCYRYKPPGLLPMLPNR